MSKPIYLCVDCGTTVVKASLIDEGYHVIDEAKLNMNTISPFPGANELDMQEVWEGLCRVTRELAERNPKAIQDLAGMGVTGQGDGLWAVDGAGEPVGNALLWNDTRARSIDFDGIPGMREAFDLFETNQIYAGSVMGLLTWLKHSRPDAYSRIRKVFHCKDWLNYRLTGEMLTDQSDASLSGYDFAKGDYTEKVFELAGIGDAVKHLAPIVPSLSIIGKITGEAAAQTGLPQGVPVMEGGVDVAVTAVGNGTFLPGSACAIIGTTLSSQIALETGDMDYSDKNCIYVSSPIPGGCIKAMPTLSGASTMDYVKALLFPEEPYPSIEKRLEELPIGSGGLIYHPYICGERIPFKDPFATAGFFGLTQSHTPLHMMRAAMEGLACSFYDCFLPLEGKYTHICLSGGASVSPTVCQMFCDMIGVSCGRISVREAGTMGIARMLPVALGQKKTVDAGSAGGSVTAFEPDRARHERYLMVYQLFKELQQGMGEFWQKRLRLL